MLQAYLDDRYKGGELETYRRVGKQIVKFVNRFLVDKITMIAPLKFKKKGENIQMPLTTLKKLMAHTRGKVNKLMSKP